MFPDPGSGSGVFWTPPIRMCAEAVDNSPAGGSKHSIDNNNNDNNKQQQFPDNNNTH